VPWAYASAFVLKPTLLGDRLQHWIDLGKQEGKTLTFSSSFESAIGLVHISKLQEIHSPKTPAGLETHRSFKHNFLPFPIEGGRLLPELIPPIDRSWLTNIAL
jgi:O-succinylbenzoate synthase